jgi:hypothetical protein
MITSWFLGLFNITMVDFLSAGSSNWEFDISVSKFRNITDFNINNCPTEILEKLLRLRLIIRN